MFKYGLKESSNAVLHHFTQACKPSSAIGHVGLPGSNLFGTTVECTTGVLSSILIENGVMFRPAGLGIPEQTSRAGRRGDLSKKMMTKTTKDTHVSGRELKDMILCECLPSYRVKACESFVRWDRDERDRRTASGKAAPAIGSQKVT